MYRLAGGSELTRAYISRISDIQQQKFLKDVLLQLGAKSYLESQRINSKATALRELQLPESQRTKTEVPRMLMSMTSVNVIRSQQWD